MADWDRGEGEKYKYSFKGTNRVYQAINHARSGRTQCRPWHHRQLGTPGKLDGRPLLRRKVVRGEWEEFE